MMIRDVVIAELRRDGGTQPRVATDHSTVDEYAEAMGRGVEFPPVVVFHDGCDDWLADGFHRVLAAHKCGRKSLAAEIREGTVRDAILFAVGANATHGKPRSNMDKRHAVTVLLRDTSWSKWSDSEIARKCAVGASMVHRIREEVSSPKTKTDIKRRKVKRAGKEYTLNTSKIGRSAREPPPRKSVDGPDGEPESPPGPLVRTIDDGNVSTDVAMPMIESDMSENAERSSAQDLRRAEELLCLLRRAREEWAELLGEWRERSDMQWLLERTSAACAALEHAFAALAGVIAAADARSDSQADGGLT